MEHTSELFPVLVPVLFVGMWCGVTALLALIGGWHRLAGRFRGRPQRVLGAVRLASASFGSLAVHYNHCLSVSVGPEGVGIAVLPIFRLFHPPIVIPWEAIERTEARRTLGLFDRTRLQLREPRVAITFRGRAARLVRDAWSATTVYVPRPAA